MSQRIRKERMQRLGEGIGDRHAAMNETILHVLGQEQRATCLGGGRDNERIREL